MTNTNIHLRRFISSACILALAFPFSIAQAEQVCSVHDGDTLTLCNGEKVRFSGIDAPELRQPLGYESRDYLRTLVLGKDVKLRCQKRRSYGRLVCHVSANGKDIEQQMVGQGWAYDYPKYSYGAYRFAESSAMASKRGVWADPGAVKPWVWRRMR